MKFLKKFFNWKPLIFLLVLALAYLGGIGYFSDKFQANTKIGVIDISNLNLAQAKKKLSQEITSESIEIKENGRSLGSIDMNDLGIEFNQLNALDDIFNNQNPNTWISYFFNTNEYEGDFLSDIQFDTKKLNDKLLDLNLNNAERNPAQDAAIEYNESQGYHIVDSQPGNQIDNKALTQGFLDAIQAGRNEIELNHYYIQPEIYRDNESIQQAYQRIEEASNTKITLDIDGNKEVITKSDIQKWMYFTPDNEIVYDENLIQESLKKYNDKYATYLKTRTFESTYQGTVTIQPGTLGWSINREAEAAQIAEDLYNENDVERQPIIDGIGYGLKDDIGNTYVEVDIANQTMFVYVNGQLYTQTPIVSGKIGAETTPGAYAIWSKETDRYLVGQDWVNNNEDYKVHVNYWMPFDEVGQGIHDTVGRSAYGGNIYLYGGSMGCINTPLGVMSEIYNVLEVGTPVIVF